MLCLVKISLQNLSGANVFSDSITLSATYLPYTNDVVLFTYSAMHNVFENTGESFSHIKRTTMTFHICG